MVGAAAASSVQTTRTDRSGRVRAASDQDALDRRHKMGEPIHAALSVPRADIDHRPPSGDRIHPLE
ncbi:hypothetical protein CHU95_00560 [Niveispirillum lacus]|uniref:Uncharacterized protein n=1 Tax=Niveispirillum lacus TaxID=1981099 RepID=A0A255Z8E3_9PROT|nr:hypothetical protein CHU95_00560 [Niveispirillum lacus]